MEESYKARLLKFLSACVEHNVSAEVFMREDSARVEIRWPEGSASPSISTFGGRPITCGSCPWINDKMFTYEVYVFEESKTW